ncbi:MULTISPECIES: TadE/TadG family type IV pilus assembly protein [Hungatella]|nr:hypothetical protein [Hungatella hathewayi]MBS4982900.1 hypothetical protein [Hungatella hathewayi]
MFKHWFKTWLKKEEGNAMIMGAFGIILLLMFMGIMVDMGLYFTSYRRLSAVTKYSSEEIQQMLPYYSFANDYESAFRTEFNKNLYEYGYTLDNVDRSTITRINTSRLGNPIISVEMDVALHDTYQCIFLPIIGISELPVNASRKTAQSYGIEKRYTAGMPVELWTGGVELDD